MSIKKVIMARIVKKRIFFAVLSAFFTLNNLVFAKDDASSVDLNEFTYLGGPKSVTELLFKILKFLNITVASVAVLAVMIGGIMLITSAGSENQMNRGKEIIKYSLIGLGLAIFAYLIVTLVQTILYAIPQ